MSKEESKISVSRSYQRTMPHSLYGGADYASTKLMATYTQEISADSKESKVKEVSDKLQSLAKDDVQEAIDEEAKRIVASAGITPNQRKYIMKLLTQTNASIQKPIDEIKEGEVSDLIEKLKEKAKKLKVDKKKRRKSNKAKGEDGKEVPF